MSDSLSYRNRFAAFTMHKGSMIHSADLAGPVLPGGACDRGVMLEQRFPVLVGKPLKR